MHAGHAYRHTGTGTGKVHGVQVGKGRSLRAYKHVWLLWNYVVQCAITCQDHTGSSRADLEDP